MKPIIQKQYRDKINQLLELPPIERPPEGWVRTFRKALGMSSRQLAARLNLSKPSVTQMERMEVEDRITLTQLRRVAQALDAKLVYALVPRQPLDTVLDKQATRKAQELVSRADTQMQLEKQQLGAEEIQQLIRQEAQRLLDTMPRDFWDD
ncbi:MAG: mobile mystery protein A [Gammaproteobacteria bacterium]